MNVIPEDSYKIMNVKKSVMDLTMLMPTPKLVNHVPTNVKPVSVPPKTTVTLVSPVTTLTKLPVVLPAQLVIMPTPLPEPVTHVTLPV